MRTEAGARAVLTARPSRRQVGLLTTAALASAGMARAAAATTGPAYLLPTMGLAAAYSGRKVVAAYAGSALKAWRASDSALDAIGFTAAGDLNTATTQAFSNAVTPPSPLQVWGWYDQTGNGLSLYQSTSDKVASRPTLATTLINGRPAVNTGYYAAAGQGQYLSSNGAKTSLSLTGDQTIATVFRSASSSQFGYIVSNYNGASPYTGWALGVNAAGAVAYWSSGKGAFATDTNVLNDGKLHVVVVTRSAGTLTIYVDGVQSLQVAGHGNAAPTSSMLVGGVLSSSSGFGLPFQGAIAELALYSRAWTSDEMSAYVAAAQSYFGVDSIRPLVGTDSIRTIALHDVTAGQVLNYERTEPWSAYAAVRLLTSCPTAGIVFTNATASGPAYPGYELWLDQYGRPRVRIISNITTPNFIGVVGNLSLLDGQPHVLGATYDGSSKAAGVSIFLDGVQMATHVESDTLTGSIVGSAQSMWIGNQNGHTDFFLPGLLDEFHLDSVQRPVPYMQAMTSPSMIPAPDASTALCYHFDEGDGLTTADTSGHGYTGTLSSSGMWI